MPIAEQVAVAYHSVDRVNVLLSADDTSHALSSAAFIRILRQEGLARVPDFAVQRVRQASIVVYAYEVGGTPSRMVHSAFSILSVKADGSLNVERVNTQQIARLDVRLDRSSRADDGVGGPVIDASQRFVARGGTWEPDARLLGQIGAAALGQGVVPSGSAASASTWKQGSRSAQQHR